jgi:hypothetical protein
LYDKEFGKERKRNTEKRKLLEHGTSKSKKKKEKATGN